MKIVQQPFTDKLICATDSCHIKLLHRDKSTNEFKLSDQTCFSDPPRTLESRVTLQLKLKLIPSFFKFMNWQSMFKENKDHANYLGFIKKVFDDMQKRFKFIQASDGQDFIQF